MPRSPDLSVVLKIADYCVEVVGVFYFKNLNTEKSAQHLPLPGGSTHFSLHSS